MKKIALIGILCLSLCHFKAKAQDQSGFYESRYYQNIYTVEDVPVGQPYYRYDYYGQVIGIFQAWEYAKWDSSSGGSYVYVWNGSDWESQWYSGTYYWFNWVVYEKRVG